MASKIVTMLTGAPALAQADLGGVSSRTLLMAGDEDAVSLDDTVALYNGIPDTEPERQKLTFQFTTSLWKPGKSTGSELIFRKFFTYVRLYSESAEKAQSESAKLEEITLGDLSAN